MATAFAPKSPIAAPSRSFQTNPTGSPSTASANAPTKGAMLSNAVFAGSRISGASQLAMTNLPETSWLPSTSPPSSPIGYLSLDPSKKRHQGPLPCDRLRAAAKSRVLGPVNLPRDFTELATPAQNWHWPKLTRLAELAQSRPSSALLTCVA